MNEMRCLREAGRGNRKEEVKKKKKPVIINGECYLTSQSLDAEACGLFNGRRITI